MWLSKSYLLTRVMPLIIFHFGISVKCSRFCDASNYRLFANIVVFVYVCISLIQSAGSSPTIPVKLQMNFYYQKHVGTAVFCLDNTVHKTEDVV